MCIINIICCPWVYVCICCFSTKIPTWYWHTKILLIHGFCINRFDYLCNASVCACVHACLRVHHAVYGVAYRQSLLISSFIAVYVHHHMKENSEYLFNLLHNEKGYLYVCGWVMCKCTNSLSLTHFLLLKLNTAIKWFSLAYKIHLLYTPSYDGQWWQQLTSSATQ